MTNEGIHCDPDWVVTEGIGVVAYEAGLCHSRFVPQRYEHEARCMCRESHIRRVEARRDRQE